MTRHPHRIGRGQHVPPPKPHTSSAQPKTPYPPLLILLALAGALLACTASFNGDGGTANGGPGGNGSTGGNGNTVSAPTVWISEPVSGAQVPANQPVEITVETNATTTNFLLNVSGRVASSVSLPGDQSGPAKAILRWTPEGEGTYSLEVYAYNGDAISAPAALILIASGVASDPGAPSTTNCTARVMVSRLNYRDGPGTNHTQLGQFDVGESVVVIGRNADSSWYQAQRFNGQQVWVINNAQWIQVEGQCSALAVVE